MHKHSETILSHANKPLKEKCFVFIYELKGRAFFIVLSNAIFLLILKKNQKFFYLIDFSKDKNNR